MIIIAGIGVGTRAGMSGVGTSRIEGSYAFLRLSSSYLWPFGHFKVRQAT